MPVVDFMTGFFGFLGVGSLVLLVILVRRAHELKRNGARTQGTVTALERDHEESLSVVVRYVVGGTPYTLSEGARRDYAVGEAVWIRYLPDDPGQASFDTWGSLWFPSILTLLLAVVFLGISAVRMLLG